MITVEGPGDEDNTEEPLARVLDFEGEEVDAARLSSIERPRNTEATSESRVQKELQHLKVLLTIGETNLRNSISRD